MIRLIIDKLGNAHNDLFFKIDAIPSIIKIADSYFLYDFLEINDEEFEKLNLKENEVIKYSALEFIRYWKERIKEIKKGDKKFVPLDLSDEYISGLLLEKTKIGFKIKIASTDKIQGYCLTKSNLDNFIDEHKINFTTEENEWFISEDTLYAGLEWSEDDIKK